MIKGLHSCYENHCNDEDKSEDQKFILQRIDYDELQDCIASLISTIDELKNVQHEKIQKLRMFLFSVVNLISHLEMCCKSESMEEYYKEILFKKIDCISGF